jgi:hypothetical protein
MMTPFDAEARVARGAALLDSHDPMWWKKINYRSLDIGSCIRCVLGQVYGTFEEGLEVLMLLNVTVNRTQQAGFSFQSSTRFYEAEELALRAAWLAEIKKRVEAAAQVAAGAALDAPMEVVNV